MKTALVIGGSRGIGRGIALKLAESGFDIWLTYHKNAAAAEEVKAEIEAKGRACEITGFDVSDYEATKAALEEKCDANPPHVMVFNSGIIRDNLMVWMTKDEWDSVIDTNLSGFYNVTKAILFPMLREKRGRIVVISSTAGQIGQA